MGRTRSMRQIALEKSQGMCCLCGLPMFIGGVEGNPLNFTLEHIVPKSRGGTNDPDNLDGSHQYCNNFKNGSLIEELPNEYRKFLKWKIKNLLANQKVRN